MPNSDNEISLVLNGESYRILLDKAPKDCIAPGNVITAHLKVQKIGLQGAQSRGPRLQGAQSRGPRLQSPEHENPPTSLVESIVRDCLQNFLNKGLVVPYTYFANKTIAITTYEIRICIDSYVIDK